MTRFAAACTYVIAVIAFALSYANLSALAVRAGYGPDMARVWPLAIDGLAVVATVAVMRLRSSRRYAWTLLAASTVVSIVAGAAAHLLPPGPLPGWAGALVAVVPPLCLLVAPHLAVQLHRDAAAGEAVAPEGVTGGVDAESDAAMEGVDAISAADDATQADDQERRTATPHSSTCRSSPSCRATRCDSAHSNSSPRACRTAASRRRSGRPRRACDGGAPPTRHPRSPLSARQHDAPRAAVNGYSPSSQRCDRM